MDRLKTFGKYALWVLGFIILGEILTNVGLNSSYKNIERRDEISQVNVYQAEANATSGKIRGIVTNEGGQDLRGKYIEFNFFSERNIFLGRRYIQIKQDLEQGKAQAFEVLFEANNVLYYDVKILDEKRETTKELSLLTKTLLSPQARILRWIVALSFV